MKTAPHWYGLAATIQKKKYTTSNILAALKEAVYWNYKTRMGVIILEIYLKGYVIIKVLRDSHLLLKLAAIYVIKYMAVWIKPGLNLYILQI